MSTSIDKTTELNRVANSLTDTDFFSGSGKKNGKEIEALQSGISSFGAALGNFIPGFGAITSVVSAVLGGLAAVFGS